MADQDQRITQAIDRERARLRRFVRSRVADPADVEEVLQDVNYELVRAYRLLKHPEQVTAWLFRVARNRITDLFRRRSHEADWPGSTAAADDESAGWEALLPSAEAGPDAVFARDAVLDAVAAALDELPREQREVFVAHELEGESFRAIAERTGVGLNTLLSRKRYAVLHLRRRLRGIHDEFER